MRKAILSSAAALLIAGAAAVPALAVDTEKGMWVDIHSGKDQYGLGVARNIADEYWVGLRADDLVSGKPTISANGMYVVPKKLLFFELYGGLGLEYDFAKTSNNLGAHIVAGNQFWVFFSEAEYNFNGDHPEYRGGFRIKF